MFYFILTLRNLKKRKLRTFLTLVGVILGVAVILAVNASGRSTVKSYERLINTVSGKSKLEVSSSSPEGFSEKKLKSIKEVASVKGVYPSITKYTIFFKDKLGKEKLTIMMMAIDPSIDRNLRDYKVLKGRFLNKTDKGVLLVDEFAKDNGLAVGSKIKVLSPKGPISLTVKGLLKKTGPARQENGAIGFINLESGQKVFGMAGRINKVDIKLRGDSGIEKAKSQLQKELGDNFDVQRPASRSADAERLLKGIKIALDFFGMVAVFVGAFLIFNTFSMNLAERSKEIATLRSIGASRSQIIILVLTEAFSLGVLGSILGIFLGRLLAQSVFETMTIVNKVYLGSVIITTQSIVLAVATGVLVSIIAAFYPARKAGRISPVSVFKEHARQRSVWIEKKGYLVGLILLLSALVLGFYPDDSNLKVDLLQVANFGVLLGMTLILPVLIKPLSWLFQKLFAFSQSAKIAGRNLPRAKLRSALTVSALTVGLIMVIGIEAMNISYQRTCDKWINSSINVDIFVRPKISYGFEIGQIVPMDIALEKIIAKTKGVKAVTPVRMFKAKSKKNSILIVASRPEKARKIVNHYFVEGNPSAAYDELEKGGSVIVSTIVRDEYGYKLGQRLPIKTAAGEKHFKIVGIISDFISEDGSATISWSDQKRYFKTDKADIFDIDIKKGFTLAQVKTKLENKLAGKGIFVMTTKDVRQQVGKEIAISFYLMDAIVFIALIVAAFGIVNTLSMSVLERQREIGIMRALGAFAGQIGLMIIAEALLIGVIGASVGLAGGLFAAYFMIMATSILTHFPVPYVLPVNAMFISAAIAVLLSSLAGIYPAFRAAKTNIIQAVQYE